MTILSTCTSCHVQVLAVLICITICLCTLTIHDTDITDKLDSAYMHSGMLTYIEYTHIADKLTVLNKN